MGEKRTQYTREFKLEAIRLMESGQKKSSDLARELGVPRNRLYKWREQLQRDGVRPETLARQERLFHRLLDAGRTVDEVMQRVHGPLRLTLLVFYTFAAFAKLKPDALFINSSRGFVVDPAALRSFLLASPDARAYIDACMHYTWTAGQ